MERVSECNSRLCSSQLIADWLCTLSMLSALYIYMPALIDLQPARSRRSVTWCGGLAPRECSINVGGGKCIAVPS